MSKSIGIDLGTTNSVDKAFVVAQVERPQRLSEKVLLTPWQSL